MTICKIFSDLEVDELSRGGCCLVHSVLEELAVNSVLGLCCCHQMHLVIRDVSEGAVPGMEESRGFLSPPPVIPETAESWPSPAPEIPCPVASTLLPSKSGSGLNFTHALWSFGSCNSSQFGLHI